MTPVANKVKIYRLRKGQEVKLLESLQNLRILKKRGTGYQHADKHSGFFMSINTKLHDVFYLFISK